MSRPKTHKGLRIDYQNGCLCPEESAQRDDSRGGFHDKVCSPKRIVAPHPISADIEVLRAGHNSSFRQNFVRIVWGIEPFDICKYKHNDLLRVHSRPLSQNPVMAVQGSYMRREMYFALRPQALKTNPSVANFASSTVSNNIEQAFAEILREMLDQTRARGRHRGGGAKGGCWQRPLARTSLRYSSHGGWLLSDSQKKKAKAVESCPTSKNFTIYLLGATSTVSIRFIIFRWMLNSRYRLLKSEIKNNMLMQLDVSKILEFLDNMNAL